MHHLTSDLHLTLTLSHPHIYSEEPGQGHVGIDVFASPTLRGGAIGTLTSGQLTLSGPQNLVCVNNSYQGCAGYGGIARLPIFIANVDANETFGAPPPPPPSHSLPFPFIPFYFSHLLPCKDA